MQTTQAQKRNLQRDDSILVTKRQKKVPLRNRKQKPDLNNSFTHNDSFNDNAQPGSPRIFPSTDDCEFPAHSSNSTISPVIEQVNNVHVPLASDDGIVLNAHNTSSNDSFEIEEVGGNIEIHFAPEDPVEEEEDHDDNQKRTRGKNKEYVLIDTFVTKEEFDDY